MYDELVKRLRNEAETERYLLPHSDNGTAASLDEAAEGGVNMRKTFCDHCGKEIKGVEINELDCDDCFFDDENQEFAGVGYTLCEKCWDERHQAHINLDMKFLHLVEEGME